jgi:cytochrome b
MPAPTNSVEPSDPTARPGRVLVWDLPVRIFHALLAGSFLLAWGIAVTSDDESRRFAFHALLGLFIGALVVFRVVWGVIGTRYARFSGFATRPAALAAYLKGILLGPEREFVGHNPASSYATFAMLVLLAGLIGTGLMLGGGNESVEDLHELFAHAMLAVVGIHVLGVILHTVRHRDPIALGMLDGRKRGAPGTAIRSARPGSALALGVLLAAWAGGLWQGYDARTGTVTLPVFGTTVALGEVEDDEGEHEGREDEEEEDDDEEEEEEEEEDDDGDRPRLRRGRGGRSYFN